MNLRTLILTGAVLLLTAGVQAQQPAARVEAGKCVGGVLLRREARDKPWLFVKEGETVFSGDLLLGLPGALVDSSNGAVRITFMSDLGGRSPLPIVETALVLHANKDVDLDFTLDRGRASFTSRKEKGTATAICHVREGKGEATLEPGASCMLEVFGRWPAGVPFKKDAKADYAPTLHLIFMVLKGEITLKLARITLAMKAPPGPAMFEWDSVHGGDPAPHRLDKLPVWAALDDGSKEAAARKVLLAEFVELAKKKSLGEAVDAFLASDDPIKRRLAVKAMGALDDLERLGMALSTTKHPDVWENGVLTFRHWIGRGPGQDQRLYEGLIKMKGFTPVDADAVVQLLHSFSDAELARPELYETLIDYLSHDKLAIRGLANWHLVRLVPEGKKIGYSPMASKEDRAKAIAAWEKLVPRGKLPAETSPKKP